MSATKRACPECGDDRHLYHVDPISRTWDPDEGRWVDVETKLDLVECTSCDWRGIIEETEVKEP